MPEQHPTGGRDLFEAVETFIEAKGRMCDLCSGTVPKWHEHQQDPPCETFAFNVLRQRFAEVRPVLGESDEVTRFRVARSLFDDVSRTVANEGRADTPVPARFDDLTSDDQAAIIASMATMLSALANVAQAAARDAL